MWQLYAVLSALFAALCAIFAKVGVKEIDSNLATAVRTTVVLLLTWSIVFFSGKPASLRDISSHTWIFLILSGLCTGLSWLCYFKSIKIGPVSRVAPVDKLSVVFIIILSALFLHETLTWKVILGGCLIAAGSILML